MIFTVFKRLFAAFVPSAEDGHPSKLLRSFHLALGGVVHLCLDTEPVNRTVKLDEPGVDGYYIINT